MENVTKVRAFKYNQENVLKVLKVLSAVIVLYHKVIITYALR